MLTPELKEFFDSAINDNQVTIFMKGTKDFPHCGFSARVVQVFNHLGVDFKDVNVMDSMDIAEGIKEYSNWPTYPQVYINQELIGGCDITCEMFESGELQEMLSK